MGTPKGASIGVVLVGLLATAATMAGVQPPVSADAAMTVRGNYCVPTDVVPVGHICVVLG
jgi:hypothetical protein